MFLVGMGAKAGYYATVGASVVAQNNPNNLRWEDGLKAAGTSHAEFVVQLAERALARKGRGPRSGRETDHRSPVWAPPTPNVTRPVDTGRN